MNGGALPGWAVVPVALLLVAFIVFAFRQGFKVTSRQDGDPPDRTGGMNF
jgi:hypothetical protein